MAASRKRVQLSFVSFGGKRILPTMKFPFKSNESYWYRSFAFTEESAVFEHEDARDPEECHEDTVRFIEAHQEPSEAAHIGVSCGVLLYYQDEGVTEIVVTERPSASPAFPGDLAIPAGYIAAGESLVQCAQRHAGALGLASEMRVAGVIDSVPSPKIHNLMFVFGQRLPERVDLSSIPGACYVAFDEALEIASHPEKHPETRFTPGLAKLFERSLPERLFYPARPLQQ